MTVPSLRYPEGPILREAADLDVPVLASEEIRHVSAARVVLADYTVIQHDFPELTTANLISCNPDLAQLRPSDLEKAVHRIIDDWLVVNAAFVSAVQAGQGEANTSIPTDGSAVGYRPPLYGRALVVPVRPDPSAGVPGGRWPGAMNGLLDLKGTGVGPGKTPGDRQATNGLEYLGWALYDYLIKRAVDAIFERDLPTLWTVPVYAVLDLGFDVLKGWFGKAPAGLHVRRAHRRVLHVAQLGQAHVDVTLSVELTLRKYGLTSRSRHFLIELEEIDGRLIGKTIGETKTIVAPDQIGLCLQLLRGGKRVAIDRVELQFARGVTYPPPSAHMYDFGVLEAATDLNYPWCEKFSISPSRVIWPDSDAFVRPDPNLRLPFETWKRSALLKTCLTLASRFRSGALSADELRKQLEEPLFEMVERWQRADADAHAIERVG